MMRLTPVIHPVYEMPGGSPAAGELRTRLVMERCGDGFMEFHGEITNDCGAEVTLHTVKLLEAGPPAGWMPGEGPWRVYRSGRHKNDLPGVFETGCADARLADVASVMTESGDPQIMEGPARQVISDHLTILRGRTGPGVVISFLTGEKQLFATRLFLDEGANVTGLMAETVFHIRLDPGETAITETLRVAETEDVEAEVASFARRKAVLSGSRSARQPAVFCTWYYYGLTVTLEDVLRNLQVIREKKLPYQVFQLDEGWEKTLGHYEPNDKFPVSMAWVAEQIRQAGLIPGLWSSPFIAHASAPVWQEHPEWMLRNRSGEPCLFPMNGTVYRIFDITHPDMPAYFTGLYRHFTFEWGFTYHKLDFTRAAVQFENAAFADPKITLAQAYRRAVQAIRRGMGEEAFFLMCGGLYDPIIGLVDAQRAGSDVLAMWYAGVNGDGKTAPFTIRQSWLRYYMNAWWANDPDALMIRRNEQMERNLRLTLGLLSEDEVQTCVINQFASGGLMCQTEPLDRMDEDRLMQIRHILPVLPRQARPLDLLDPGRFPGAMDVQMQKTGAHCVCLINWSDTEVQPVSVSLAALRLEPEGEYVACDFASGTWKAGLGAGDTVTFPPLQPHAATVVKVEKRGEQPVIVASDGHFAMGAECDRLEIAGGKLCLSRPALFPVAAHYQVLLPLADSRPDRVIPVTLAPGQETAEIDLPGGPERLFAAGCVSKWYGPCHCKLQTAAGRRPGRCR